MRCIVYTASERRPDMVFNELYSAYYNAVAHILTKLLDGEQHEKELQKTVAEYAFAESTLNILPSLKSEKWQLMHADMTTPLDYRPTMPLTLLQKQWLRAIMQDPRIRLFDLRLEGLDSVDPLFTSAVYYVYDKYSDGDPFEDEAYIARFRTILNAIHQRTPLWIEMINRKGSCVRMRVMPQRLEYSEKDDKFRLITTGCRFGGTVNLGRMTACRPCHGEIAYEAPPREPTMRTVVLRVTDERNALERAMLHFAHFEKHAEKIDNMHYRLSVRYDADDETELVIRILSFGPFVHVEEPQAFAELIRERLRRQKKFTL